MMFFLGALFVVLIVGILMLVGALGAAKVDVKLAHNELAECQLVLGRYALLEQQRQKMKEDINVSFTEEQITTLAGRISTRVKTILDNEQQMALNKLS